MSTRSVIARKTATGFTGVYHHWDGYPEGVGSTLLEVFAGHFQRDLPAMLRFLIDEHPQGWSTINSADWSLPAGPRGDGNSSLCETCGLPQWTHYAQYYSESHGEGRPLMLEIILQSMLKSKAEAIRAGQMFQLFDHSFKARELPHGPECYAATEGKNEITEESASGCGCEYAYVFDESAMTMAVLSSYRKSTSTKMIGMFGCGDPDCTWEPLCVIDLNGNVSGIDIAQAVEQESGVAQ